MCEQERRERILDATNDVLRIHGYQGTSMDRIANEACMSKKTLYQLFDSKQTLFETLFAERLFEKRLYGVELEGDTAEQKLTYGLCRLVRVIMQESRLNLMRVVIMEVSRHPELSEFVSEFFADRRTPNALKIWIEQISDDHKLAIGDSEAAADMLFGMTAGVLLLGALTHCRPRKSDADNDAFVERAVGIFLSGVRAGCAS